MHTYLEIKIRSIQTLFNGTNEYLGNLMFLENSLINTAVIIVLNSKNLYDLVLVSLFNSIIFFHKTTIPNHLSIDLQLHAFKLNYDPRAPLP